jgi:hypothetical protein
MKKHFFAVSLIASLVFIAGALVTFEESCQLPAPDAARVVAGELPCNGPSD